MTDLAAIRERVEALDGMCHDGEGLGCETHPCVENVSRAEVLALLADTPSVEPPCEHEWEVRVSTSGGTVVPSPSRTMGHVAVLPDARWECVKCGTPRDDRPSVEPKPPYRRDLAETLCFLDHRHEEPSCPKGRHEADRIYRALEARYAHRAGPRETELEARAALSEPAEAGEL